ncbi:hypothetical protein CPB84DRAFT_1962287 [Gymnopilus junonius]|uniref:Uncharacterized protein n=1 Tax=Gymnopilus junonius TaxID=109634 RepID=A0A9P5NQI5_GYMJU|nr:hypothetical protein CPB84DRAFT_1962287 [Gymnopilus junonius]
MTIKETREAPWYGPWTIALDLLFLDLQLPRHTFCAIVPQLPIIRRYDPIAYDDDLAAVAALNLGVETHHIVSDQVDNALDRPLGGQSYPVTPRTRSIPPSNDSGYILRAFQCFCDKLLIRPLGNEPSTPTRKVPVPQPFDSVNSSPIEIDHAPPAGRGSIRSTRVPDFSALIHLFDQSEINKSYLLLIVENKPFSDDPESVIIQTIEQVLEQAQRALGLISS